MKKEREELRRGLRAFIQDAGAELADFTNGAATPEPPAPMKPAAAPQPPTQQAGTLPAKPPADPPPATRPPAPIRPPAPTRLDEPIKPILKLVRDVPQAEPEPQLSLEELTRHLPKKGVCAAYFANKRCWELPDAYCNHALQVCRMRECPVYDLHREEMERRFAAKFSYLW